MNYSTMTKIDKHKFIIAGGINSDATSISNKSYLFDAEKNEVLELAAMNQERYTHFATIFDGFLYVFGGRTYGTDEEAILSHC